MSLYALLELSRKKLTPEQTEDLRLRMIERDKKFNEMLMKRFRCSICGADTYNYSHLFDCPRRGSGF